MKIRFRSLESRIATLFLALLVVVQVISLLVIQHGIARNERNSISHELTNGEKVLSSLVEQNAQKLRLRAQVVARDTAFVQAIGNTENFEDLPTLQSALINSGLRARADLTMLINGNRQVVIPAALLNSEVLNQLALSLLDQADQSDGASAIAIIDHKPYQIIVMPVKAPITIAWVVMGFAIDHHLATDMKELSALDTVLLTRTGNQPWYSVASTLSNTNATSIVKNLQQLGTPPTGAFDINGEETRYRAKLLTLGRDGTQQTSVLLIRSIDEATAEYRELERLLMALTIVSIFFAALVSILTAKRLAQPLRQLAETAGQLERGDYGGVIKLKRDDEIGALAHALANMRDGISKREQEIRHLAYWDPLTNLPNRAQFAIILNESITAAKQRDQHVFVLMMDLDRFKHVNDIMGHSFGDALLRAVGERLQAQVENTHTSAQVARLGGDEFAILLPHSDLIQAKAIARNILRALEQPLTLEDQTVDLGAGLGIAGFPMHAADAEALLSMAELAMYSAKQLRDGAVVYDPTIDQTSEQSLSLLTELRNALERNEFLLYVQPKLELATGKVVGLESLMRWKHPERGMVFPDEFILFAEQTAFIRSITHWVLEQSAALSADLQRRGHMLKVSVNLSTRDLSDPELPTKFAEILTRFKLTAESFCLEITESAIMDDPARALQTLETLHDMGAELSIDDFGTGYSSLAYLKRLPVDELKIDKSFVMNMVNDEGDTKIVRSTIDLGHNMGLRVVAEGIESAAIWHLLKKLGCDQGQGYFMTKPIPGPQLVAWIAAWQPPVAPAEDLDNV
jgi:diguanylate cyclase (GGDEF)-like protein